MAKTASPYGLRPVSLVGGLPYAGATREIKMSTNNATALAVGDLVVLSAAGNPIAAAATPVAGTTAGIVGVVTGIRFVNPATKQPNWGQYLPANAITAGYTDVYVSVCDDPNAVFQVQGSAAFGTLTNGADGAVGKNAALGNFAAQSAVTGLSGVNVVVGANGGSLASTNTLAVRVIGVVPGTELDTYPELLVKLNAGVHSYNFALGV